MPPPPREKSSVGKLSETRKLATQFVTVASAVPPARTPGGKIPAAINQKMGPMLTVNPAMEMKIAATETHEALVGVFPPTRMPGAEGPLGRKRWTRGETDELPEGVTVMVSIANSTTAYSVSGPQPAAVKRCGWFPSSSGCNRSQSVGRLLALGHFTYHALAPSIRYRAMPAMMQPNKAMARRFSTNHGIVT